MSNSDALFIFGYGSLANLHTHDYSPISFTSLHGYERVWVTSATRNHAYLSIRAATKGAIEGVILSVPNDALPALNEREKGYMRIDVSDSLQTPMKPCSTYLRNETVDSPAPILYSYLATVLSGFYELGGTDAAQAFLTTTKNWGPILMDENDPQYPRFAVDPAHLDEINALIHRLT